MGCSGSIVSTKLDRLPQPREEIIIKNLETNLPFSNKSLSDLMNSFKLNSFNDVLTYTEFTKSLEQLSWVSYIQNKNNSLGKVISLITRNNKIPVITLCFLSILLGKATLENKAEILFTLIDRETKGTIKAQVFKYVLNALIMISIEILPQIAYDNQCLTFTEIQDYTLWLKRKKNGLIKKILTKVLDGKNEIAQNRFVKRIKTIEKYQHFLSATGIRMLLFAEEIPRDIGGMSKVVVMRKRNNEEMFSPRSSELEIGLQTEFMIENNDRRVDDIMEISTDYAWDRVRNPDQEN
ncbi:hypothetical protein SteCoe_17400 [Stentor coeruleus]|uniref:EF-hand domain-containing protein n=1 Tax=Stentor coeruleus TaxID=5963 RepID=A0A1R2BZC8_9CILI|nr:hypothetical protein SteCoe_17400 [Stentor coeruleus]